MRRTLPLVLLLLASVPAVFSPIASGRYTLSTNPWSADPSKAWLSHDLPVWDPAAGGLQDEPWLHHIREHLREGRVALVNLHNGLGAPLLESLQPGALYLLNPLLLLTYGQGPGFFDFFSLAHVALLVVGLFFLLRLYARAEIALALAVLVGFSGVTYHNVNMVHFRGFAWLPWMLLGVIRSARGATPSSAALLAVATVGAATAGNLQDFAMSLGVVTVIGAAEVLQAAAGCRLRGLATAAGALVAGLAIAAPAYVPYLASRSAGNLASVGDGARCLAETPPDLFFSWILPRAHGTQALQFRRPFQFDPQPDFTSTGFLLLCIGAAALLSRRGGPERRYRALLAVLFALLATFALKIVNVWPFTLCAGLPFVSGIRFTKYCLQEAVVAAIIVAIAAEHATTLPAVERRRLLRRALVPFGAGIAALLLWMWLSDHWHLTGGFHVRAMSHLVKAWVTSIVTVPLFVALVFLRERPAWRTAAALFVVHAALVLPTGYWRAQPARAISAEGLREVARATDQRVVSRLHANSNLFFGFEDLAVFDPVLNGAFQRFMAGNFQVDNPYFHLQFHAPLEQLTPVQVAAMQLVGVGLVEQVPGPTPRPPFAASDLPGLVRLEGALPRAFLVDAESARHADALCAAGDLPGAVETLRGAAANGPALSERRGVNRVVVESAGDSADGILVLSRAYTTAWRLEGEPPRPLCGVLSSWPTSPAAGERLDIEYRPPHLGLAVRVAIGGAVALGLLVAALGRARTSRRRAAAAGSPRPR